MKSAFPLLLVLAAWPLSPTLPARAGEPAKWTHAGWGGGGFFWAVAFDPANAANLHLAGDVAGLYKSTDRGLTWRMANTGVQNYAVYGLAVAPSNPNILYAMTVDGMARSEDAAETWIPLPASRAQKISAARASTVRAIAIDPENPRALYAGSGSGQLFASDDAGETWRQIPFTETTEPAIASVVLHGETLFVCHRRQGLFRGNGRGATWTQPETPSNAAHVAFHENRAYGAFAKDGLWASDDAGLTWRKLPNIPGNLDLREVAIHPADPETVHFIALDGWNGFHGVTRDGGATWTLARTLVRDALSNPALPGSFGRDPVMSRVSSLALAPSEPSTLFIAGNWNNLLSTDSGATWRQRDHGTDITCFTDLRFLNTNGETFTLATAMDQGVYLSRDHGATWQHLFPRKYREGDNGHFWRVLAWPGEKQTSPSTVTAAHGDAHPPIRLLATSTPWRGNREYPNTLLASLDSGATFTATTAGLPEKIPRVNTMWGEGYARALAESPDGALYLGMDGDDGGGLFKSIDLGLTWQRLPNQPPNRRVFYGLAADPQNPAILYWGACGENAGVFRTLDAGETWEKTPLAEWVFNLETTPSGTLYAGGDNLWQSRDHATTWRKLTDFKAGSVVGIAIDPGDENRLWVSLRAWGTSAMGGVFHSSDGGETWQDITGGLPYVKPLVLRYNPQTQELWAAGTGLFKTTQ